MPSISTIDLKLNLPPKSGSLTVKPTIGDALTTIFKIKLDGWIDSNQPITYKFHIYKSEELLTADILQGLDFGKIVLTDFQASPLLETVLPSTDVMIILVSISDSLGGITNMTQKIQITSVEQQFKNGLPLKTFLDQVYRSLQLDQAVADQSELSSLIIAAQELGDLAKSYKTSPDLKKTVMGLFRKLNSLQGKLTS